MFLGKNVNMKVEYSSKIYAIESANIFAIESGLTTKMSFFWTVHLRFLDYATCRVALIFIL